MMDSNSRARIPGQGQFLRTRSSPSSFLKTDLSHFGHLFYEVSFWTYLHSFNEPLNQDVALLDLF
jgi:hypothetical protein